MKPADVDAAVTENSSDASNHARHIAIMHDQHVAVGNRFDMKTVNLSDAALARLAAVNKHAARQRLLVGVANHAGGNSGSRVCATAHVTGSDFDAPLFGDQEGVDYVHARADIAQQA